MLVESAVNALDLLVDRLWPGSTVSSIRSYAREIACLALESSAVWEERASGCSLAGWDVDKAEQTAREMVAGLASGRVSEVSV